MKYSAILALVLLAAVVFEAGAQREEVCPAASTRPRCFRERDEGNEFGDFCRFSAGSVWYFNRRLRRCERMFYRGCGGNENRFCTLRACTRRCLNREV